MNLGAFDCSVERVLDVAEPVSEQQVRALVLRTMTAEQHYICMDTLSPLCMVSMALIAIFLIAVDYWSAFRRELRGFHPKAHDRAARHCACIPCLEREFRVIYFVRLFGESTLIRLLSPMLVSSR